jgi:hypothetical protein
MEDIMAGTTVSFVADRGLVERVQEIAKADGVSQSQAAARASAFGALLPSASRMTLRFILEEGGPVAEQELVSAIVKAIARVGNAVLERQVLADAARMGRNHGGETEEDLAHMSVEAVRDTRRKRRDQPTANDDVIDPHSPGFGD